MKKKKFSPKTLVNTLHLWLGLASGLVVLVVATTGALYAFEEEYRATFQQKYLYVEAQAKPQLPPSQLLTVLKRQFPNEKITQLRLRNLPENAAALAITKSRRIISLNPYTGAVVGERNLNTDFMTVVVQLHTNLLLGDLGEPIIKANVLIFLLMVLSGLVLWWPANWKFWRGSFTVKWRAKAAKRNYDLHSVGGFYASLVLLLIGLTGVYWMYDSAKALTYWVTGSAKPKEEKLHSVYRAGVAAFPVDSAFAAVLPYGRAYTLASLQLPADSVGVLRVLVRYPYRWVRKQNSFQFDAYSGKVLKADLAANYTPADKIRVSNFDLHTGRLFGLPGKLLWFLASLFAASLPVTGFLIWWGRRKKARVARPNTLRAGRHQPAKISQA